MWPSHGENDGLYPFFSLGKDTIAVYHQLFVFDLKLFLWKTMGAFAVLVVG